MKFREFLTIWNTLDEVEYDKVYIYTNDDTEENHHITVPIYLLNLALGKKIEISMEYIEKEHPDYKTLVEHLKSLLDENIKKFYYATEDYSCTCACVVLEMF